jgi:acetyl esterase
MKLLRTVAPLAQAAIRGAGSLLASLPIAPHERDGHRLDPHTRAVCLAAKLARVPHLATMKPATARRAMEEQMWLLDGPSPEMAEVRDIKLPASWGSLPVRLYRPVNAEVGGPLIIWYHGGGWVIGSITSHDGACRRLADATGMAVLAADYRLAPEHPCPAAWEDALTIFDSAVAHAAAWDINPARIAVCGDSAGGNLAACVALARAASDHPPALQVLLYPGVELTRSFASHKRLAEGYILDDRLIGWMLGNTFTTEQLTDPAYSPWYAKSFAKQPPAIVITAGFDVLRDEGDAYAVRLRDAGNKVEHRCETGMIHGFLTMTGAIPEAEAAVQRMAKDLVRLLRGSHAER